MQIQTQKYKTFFYHQNNIVEVCVALAEVHVVTE